MIVVVVGKERERRKEGGRRQRDLFVHVVVVQKIRESDEKEEL